MPRTKLVTAHKQHICKLCGLPIIIGTPYILQTFRVFTGPITHNFEHHRYHTHCDWNRTSPTAKDLFERSIKEAYAAMERLYGRA